MWRPKETEEGEKKGREGGKQERKEAMEERKEVEKKLTPNMNRVSFHEWSYMECFN